MNVVVVGSLNLDLQLDVERIPSPGETVLGRDPQRSPGGKGGNQAVAAARAGGASTAFIGAVGSDSDGRELIAALQRDGVRVAARVLHGAPTGNAIVLRSSDGENAIVVVPGANGQLDALTTAERDIVASGSVILCQLETPASLLADVLDAGRGSSLVILNAAPAMEIPPELLARVDLLVVNEHELAAVAGGPGADPDTMIARALESVPAVVLTLGSRGVRYATGGGEHLHIPAHSVEVVDTTAAGDTFCGVLGAALARGGDVGASLRLANAAAALTVTRPGAQTSVPTAAALEQFLAHCGYR